MWLLVVILKISALWLVHVAGILFYHLIRSYHNCKPLGRQTLLGKVIASLFMNVLMIMAVYHAAALTIILFIAPIERYGNFEIAAKAFAFFSCFTIMASEIALLGVLLTKYLSIYHSAFVYGLNEDKTIKLFLSSTMSLAMLLTSWEYSFVTRLDSVVMYQILLESPNDDDANVEKVKIGTFLVIFCISGFFASEAGI